MSAYALPGPGLFPPLPSQFEESAPASALSSGKENIPFDQKEVFEEDVSVQHESREDVCTVLRDPKSSERVGIAVKEAKINSALLVQTMANADSNRNNGQLSQRRLRSRHEHLTSEDEAMQFELSVTLGGRKYSAIRSWPSICKFRKDLIRSLSSYEIPELPTLHEPGVLYRSFSFLRCLVESYAPTLDTWLKRVTALVPHDNPILNHFLYEESFVENQADCSVQNFKEVEKRSSDSQLDAIDETEYEEEEQGDDVFFR